MNPWQVLRQFSQQYPKAAALVMGAVACFAAVAVVASFGIDLEARIPSVLYVIGIGALLLIVVAMLNDQIMMAFVRWFALATAIVWLAVFIAYRIQPSPVLACAVFFWSQCRTTADVVAAEANPPPPRQADSPQPKQNAGSQLVYFQFAGVLERDDVRSVMRRLRDAGWRIQGVEGGGERTASAAGFAEVRYAASADKRDAEALAAAVQATKLISKPITAKESPLVKKNTLEVWISR